MRSNVSVQLTRRWARLFCLRVRVPATPPAALFSVKAAGSAPYHERQSALDRRSGRSEEHTSELQSLMRSSYAIFCLKKKTKIIQLSTTTRETNTHNSSNSIKNKMENPPTI